MKEIVWSFITAFGIGYIFGRGSTLRYFLENYKKILRVVEKGCESDKKKMISYLKQMLAKHQS